MNTNLWFDINRKICCTVVDQISEYFECCGVQVLQSGLRYNLAVDCRWWPSLFPFLNLHQEKNILCREFPRCRELEERCRIQFKCSPQCCHCVDTRFWIRSRRSKNSFLGRSWRGSCQQGPVCVHAFVMSLPCLQHRQSFAILAV